MKREKLSGNLFKYGVPSFRYLNEEDKHFFADSEPEFKVNVIGCGMIGQEHMKVAHQVGRVKIHGVFDTNPRSVKVACEEFAKVGGDARSLVQYATMEEACNDPAVDGLFLCTPNFSHIDVARVAAKSGKHIFLEKPMATTLEDAWELVGMARDYKSVFQIGLQYRYKPIYEEVLHEVLKRGAVGDVKMVNILEHRIPFLDKIGQWNKFNCWSGGTLVEKCCHYFDMINHIAASRPVRVFATGAQAVNFRGYELEGRPSDILDSAYVTVEYENGVRGGFNLCMFAPMFHEEIIVCGDEGRVKAFEMEDFGGGPRLRTGLEVHRGDYGPSKVAEPHYPHIIEDTGHNGATWFEHIRIADNMAGKPTDSATAEDGFWSVVVGYAAQEAIRRGQVVEINDLLREHGIDI